MASTFLPPTPVRTRRGHSEPCAKIRHVTITYQRRPNSEMRDTRRFSTGCAPRHTSAHTQAATASFRRFDAFADTQTESLGSPSADSESCQVGPPARAPRRSNVTYLESTEVCSLRVLFRVPQRLRVAPGPRPALSHGLAPPESRSEPGPDPDSVSLRVSLRVSL